MTDKKKLLQSVSPVYQGQRVLLRRRAELIHCKALGNVVTTQWAVAADHIGQAAVLVIRHGLEQRFANFHRLLVIRHFDAKRAGVTRAALVRLHAGARHHLEHFFGLLADVLYPTVARNLVADLAQRYRKFGL